jgi:hypothetical protein
LLLHGIGVRAPGSSSPGGNTELQYGELSPQGCDLDLGGTETAVRLPRRPRANADVDLLLPDSFQPAWIGCPQQGKAPMLLGHATPCAASETTCEQGGAQYKSMALTDLHVHQEAQADITATSTADTLASVVGACMDSCSDFECVVAPRQR